MWDLARQCVEQLRDRVAHDEIDNEEVGCKREHRENHDHGGGAHLLPGRPCDAMHLEPQIIDVVLQPRGQTRGSLAETVRTLLNLCHRHRFTHFKPGLDRYLAGAEGFEPPLAVLETAGLPLNLRPYSIVASSEWRVATTISYLALTNQFTSFPYAAGACGRT